MYYGVDVSDWQGNIYWPTVWTNTEPVISFVYSKSTDGSSYVSETFAENHDMVRETGRDFGAYHFFRFEDDPIAQANLFISNTLALGRGGNCIPMVDVEIGNASAERLEKFCVAVRSAFKVPKLYVYTDPGWWDASGLGDSFAGQLLWVANPASSPELPTGWSDWSIWQYANNGVVKGIGNTDLDQCRDRSILLRPQV